jgi:hypothetical protein
MTTSNIPLRIEHKGRELRGVADPIDAVAGESIPRSFGIYVQGSYLGIITCEQQGWVLDRPADPDLVEFIGNYLHAWFE